MSKTYPIKALLVGPVHTASFKIGILQPFIALQKQGICNFKAIDDMLVRKSAIAAADIVIFCRTTKPEAYRILEWAHKLNKQTVYVIDDHFLAMPSSTSVGNKFKNAEYRKTFINFLRHAHVVKVASPFFASHLKRHFRTRKIVCFPGSVDFSLVEGLSKLERKDKKVVIGYAGGIKDKAFVPVIRALKRVLRKYGDKVEVQFFGYMPSTLKGHANIIHYDHEYDYPKYLKRLYQLNWDIGLAPLEHALHHDCKTDNKFREYAACSISGIYSNSPAYRYSVINGETGLLLGDSVDEWYGAMRKLIEQPKLRLHIASDAGKLARKHYSIEDCAKKWNKKIIQSS